MVEVLSGDLPLEVPVLVRFGVVTAARMASNTLVEAECLSGCAEKDALCLALNIGWPAPA